MTFDRRFPNLVRLSRLSRAEREGPENVCRRCMVNACWNRANDMIHFYVGNDPHRGVYQQPRGKWTSGETDEVCKWINTRHKPRKLQELEQERREAEKKYQKDQEREKRQADLRPEIRDKLAFKHDREGQTGKRSAIVSGLKKEGSSS